MKTHRRLAAILNITEEHICRLQTSDPKFGLAISQGDDYVNGKIIDKLSSIAVDNGDLGAIKYWLNNRVLNEWADRSKQEIEAKISTLDKLVDTLENTYEPIKESTEPIEQKS